jgi:hypothetical protein
MILNPYAVLSIFFGLLRLTGGAVLLALGLASGRRFGRSNPEQRHALEDRTHLLFQLALLLLGLSVLSWPLWYLLLQSYVAAWPEVMCIYGVTQVGRGSVGIARVLPHLVMALHATKPVLVFLGGTWLLLHWANRRGSASPLLRRVLWAAVLLGGAAGLDALIELAYVVIPKREQFPPVGCCIATFGLADRAARFPAGGLFEQPWRSWLHVAYCAAALGTTALLSCATFRARAGVSGRRCMACLAAVAVASPVLWCFWVEIAAPALLGLPLHHCLYDLAIQVPESTVAMGLVVLANLSVAWACVLRWWGRCGETANFVDRAIGRCMAVALFGYVGSTLMVAVAMAMART